MCRCTWPCAWDANNDVDRGSRHDHQQSTSLLASQAQGHPGDHDHDHNHGRRYSASEDDDLSAEDSWTDTGDIAEQLDGEEDPLRRQILNNDSALDDEILASVFKRQQSHKHSKRVRHHARRSSSGESRSHLLPSPQSVHGSAGPSSPESLVFAQTLAPRL